jgi:hypothetical protein
MERACRLTLVPWTADETKGRSKERKRKSSCCCSQLHVNYQKGARRIALMKKSGLALCSGHFLVTIYLRQLCQPNSPFSIPLPTHDAFINDTTQNTPPHTNTNTERTYKKREYFYPVISEGTASPLTPLLSLRR